MTKLKRTEFFKIANSQKGFSKFQGCWTKAQKQPKDTRNAFLPIFDLMQDNLTTTDFQASSRTS